MSKFSVKDLMNTADPVPADASVPVRPIEQITVEINFYKAQTVQNIIEIGKRLTEAKTQLPHGKWSEWLKDSVDFSERSAQNFIRIAEQYPNPQPVADLSYTKMIALLQIPTEDRGAFLAEPHSVNGEEKTVQDMSKRELEQAIKACNAADKRANDEANRAKRFKEESEVNFKKYMNALVEGEKAAESSAHSRDSLSLDNRLLQEKLRIAEKQKADPLELRKIREEAQAAARAAVQDELDALKNGALETAALDSEITMDAGEAFENALDAAFAQFESIIKCSDPAAVVECMPSCVKTVRAVYDAISKLDAASRNLLLTRREDELPADFYDE